MEQMLEDNRIFPDPGTAIQTSKLFRRNDQVWFAVRFTSRGETITVKLPAALCLDYADYKARLVTRTKPEWR